MSIGLTPGQAGDKPQLLPLLDQVAVGARRARPASSPAGAGLADKANSHLSTRAALRLARDRLHQPGEV